MAAYPPGITTPIAANLQAHMQQVFITGVALDQLMKKFRYREVFKKYKLPKGKGRTVQMHRYDLLGPSTTSTTEGVVGNSLNLTSKAVQVTPAQFSSFITVSDLQQATAPDDQLEVAGNQLGYRAGYTLDNLHRAIIDDQAPSITQALQGAYLSAADLAAVRHLMQGIDIEPYGMGGGSRGWFLVYAHPYVTYDLVRDPSINGLGDTFKYNTDVKSTPLVSYEDRGTITEIGGCRVVETTNVNVSSGSYRAYVFGKDALGCVDLEGFEPSEVSDPSRQNFSVNVQRTKASAVDPEGLMAGFAAYKFVTGGSWLAGPEGIGDVFRARVLECPSNIV